MRVEVRGAKDFFAGLMLVVFGLAAVYLARGYPMGSLLRMGPGYFPTVLGWLLALLGAAVMLRGMVIRSPALTGFNLKALVLILGAVVLFALTVERLGIVAAVVLVVLVSALADNTQNWRQVALLAAVMVALAVGLFTYGLGLPFRIWPG